MHGELAIGQTEGMDDLSYSQSIVVARAPEELYDMVADVTRMGEWSPVCKECWWDEGAGPEVGAWFTGRNDLSDRSYETRSQVIAADRGREFAFIRGGNLVRWGYQFAPVDGGTEVTESWELLPDWVTMVRERAGDGVNDQIVTFRKAAEDGIGATLAAIKSAAEAS
jgi:hypothetical protein